MVVELRMQYCREMFRVHLRPMGLFTVHICPARAPVQSLKSLKIVHFGGMILRIGFH